MIATLSREVEAVDVGSGDNLDHVFCYCNEDLALCGLDLQGVPMAVVEPTPGELCVVCDDLWGKPCGRCGA